MQIYGPTHVHPSQPISAPHATQGARGPQGADQSAQADRVEISTAAQLVDRVHDLPEIRAERVAQIRAAIADGSYETDEKLGAAVERLLDEIG